MRLLTALLQVPGLKPALGLCAGGALLWPRGGTLLSAQADSSYAVPLRGSSTADAVGNKGQLAAASAPPPTPQQPGGGDSPLPAALMQRLLGPNDFASGGLMLMLVGAAAAGARVLIGSALRWSKRYVMVQAEVDSRDDAYRWLMFWLSRHPKFRNSTSVSVTTNLTGTFGTSVPPVTAQAAAATADDDGSGDGPPVAFLPAPGDHLLRYRGVWMLISRQRNSGNPQLAANARLLMETLRISLLGTNRTPLEVLLREAAASYNAHQACRTVVHSVDSDGYWTQVGSRPIRPLSTVILPEGKADMLLADCREFLASEAWYAHHGIPFRRGYLLYGPPGTGKTSLVMALAGALGLDIYVVTLSSPTMTDETLRHLLNTAGTRSILLLEDVDAAFVNRSASQGTARLTFSGLLNAIDGVAAQEGRLLFQTTNHIERLSSALIRPGRVDVRCFLGPARREQAKEMFLSFYRDLPAAAAAAAPPPAAADKARPVGSGAAGGGGEATPLLLPHNAGEAGAAGGTGPMPVLQRSGTSVREAAEREAVLAQLAERFAAQLPPEPALSTAQLQAFLMTHRRSPSNAVASAGAWVEQQAVALQEAATLQAAEPPSD